MKVKMTDVKILRVSKMVDFVDLLLNRGQLSLEVLMSSLESLYSLKVGTKLC